MTVRFGIIGTGGIADAAHAPAIAAVKETSLVAVLSRQQETARAFLVRHSVPQGRAYTNIADFVHNPAIDAVIVASPDRLHARDALACLEAGKHVLLEKPMAISIDEAVALQTCAEKNQCVLAVGFHLRAHAGHQMLYDEIINKNAVGKICHIRAIWAFSYGGNANWRASEELGKWWSLAAVGSHCLDLVRWFANDYEEWKNFHSVIDRSVWNGPHDETAVMAGQYSNNITADIVSSVQFGPVNRLEIYGDKGTAFCEGTFGRHGTGQITLNNQVLAFTPINPFAAQLQRFVDAAQNKGKPYADASVGVRSVKDLLRAGG